MPTIQVIPATKDFHTHLPSVKITKRRTAGYARVSTDKDEQFTSYEAQIDYYTSYIQSHTEWEFVKVYTDEGISATNTKHREGFNEMIEDALNGKIDLIITKSVSRFARNTVDSLSTIRKLKEKGVEVYFEKENIWTFDNKGEVLLTIMSSLAQEESRSISENVTWGKRKSASDGKVSVGYKHFLGYEKGKNKGDPMVINPEQAEIVKRIYREFMRGKTPFTICRELTDDGIPTPGGKKQWNTRTINSILTNEKYKGAALLQKTYTSDFLTKKIKKNNGEVPQYYVTDSHEAIIPPDEWEAVQREYTRRKASGRQYSGKTIFSSKIFCGDCGGHYGAKVWHSNNEYRTVVWQCNDKYKKEKEKCKTPHLTEEEIRKKFIDAFNDMFKIKDEIISNCKMICDRLTDTSQIDSEISGVISEMRIVAELTEKCIERNSQTAQNQEDYAELYESYVERYNSLKERHKELTTKKTILLGRADTFKMFVSAIERQPGPIAEFDNDLWHLTVQKGTVERDGSITFLFFDDSEINV